ncbi:MAG: endopeptidase La [Gemmatimonadota bacterium]
MPTLTRVDDHLEIPERLPVLALRDLVFFPYMVLPLLIGRAPSLRALEEAADTDGLLLAVAQLDPETEDPTASDLHRVGTVVRVLQTTHLPDGTARVVFEGVGRGRVTRFSSTGESGMRATLELLTQQEADPPGWKPEASVEALCRRVLRMGQDYIRINPDLADELAAPFAGDGDRVRQAHLLAGHLLLPAREKQPLLEAADVPAQYQKLRALLEREMEILQIEETIDQQMRRHVDSERRQAYLQEQLKIIHRELDAGEGEWGDLEEKLASTPLPAPAQDRAEREMARLRRLTPASPEAGIIRTYLDWILALPWEARSPDTLDVARASTILEAEHFGLEEVKDRILDHIAVLSLVGELQGPILCLAGPPGVGKTSLGRSIARSLGREFVRVSLGGVRDEAEIRGHRRTYVGALPGRVLQGMRRSGTRNPVFLLDEVDKLSRDFHGDPGAALLEVLDPEQNKTFTDHYLELEFDLSDVLFVATANGLAGIPEPLRDRMEIIRIPGYLDTEKQAIAREFLWPRQLTRHGLAERNVKLEDSALSGIMEGYTREAGVRELDRQLSRLARKAARGQVEAGRASRGRRPISAEQLPELLGPPPFSRVSRESEGSRVGISTGLAWTAAGGELLQVEVAVVPGQGRMQLTGTLGEVMKESAAAALTYARSRARTLGLRSHFQDELDLHIHVPEGATPKDGPSAGITMAVALISALTGVPTRSDVALTGEITLRGRVLPVGGIREKAVAAAREGIRTVILPADNEGELARLPQEVLERVTFISVSTMDEVLDAALGMKPGLMAEEGGGPSPLLT